MGVNGTPFTLLESLPLKTLKYVLTHESNYFSRNKKYITVFYKYISIIYKTISVFYKYIGLCHL